MILWRVAFDECSKFSSPKYRLGDHDRTSLLSEYAITLYRDFDTWSSGQSLLANHNRIAPTEDNLPASPAPTNDPFLGQGNENMIPRNEIDHGIQQCQEYHDPQILRRRVTNAGERKKHCTEDRAEQ